MWWFRRKVLRIMKNIISYKLFESKIDLNSVVDHVNSMLFDLEDVGYGYQAYSSTQTSYPSSGKRINNIEILIYRRGQPTILIEDIDYKIEQITGIINNFYLKPIILRISPSIPIPGASLYTHTIKYKSLGDFSIKKGLADTSLHEVEFQILEYGMNEWISEMTFVSKQGSDYKFKSTKQWDDFEVVIDEKDIETDVRPVIKEIKIQLSHEEPDTV